MEQVREKEADQLKGHTDHSIPNEAKKGSHR